MNFLFRFVLWWLKNPTQKTICLVVISCHLAIIGWLSTDHPNSNKPNKKLIIKTFTPPKTTTKTTVSTPTPQKKSPISPPVKKNPPPPIKKPETQQKKTLPLPKKEETPVKKRKTYEVSNKKSVSQERLKELEERISKIAEKNDRIPIKSELKIPPTIALSASSVLQMNSQISSEEVHREDEEYVSFLIGYLQECLQLPDVGEVKIQISLRKDGSVETMKVIHTESAKNRKYLEEHLPDLSFPRIPSDSSHSFLITFCNKF